MSVRLLLSVAVVASILVLVLCTDETRVTSSSRRRTIFKTSSKKICIKIKRCPKNEEFSYCPQSLQRAQYCSEKGKPLRYVKSDRKPCRQGCVCKDKYLRADNRTCIPAEQCKITCGPNEVLNNCPANCKSDYCPTSDEEEDTETCTTPEVCPPPACECAFNHKRAENESCIPTRDCPPFDCSGRPNQEYNSCPALCPTDDCSQATPTGKCPLPGRIGIVLECNPKCRCIKGYWKLNETCVPYGECPGVCPANERYSECIQGECRALNCTDKDESIPCLRIDPKFCKKGCVCEEGYFRNSNGTCVLKDQCESNITCGPNEVLNNCPASCKSDYCPTSEEDTKACTTPKVCPPPACECSFNYKRAANKSCIPTRDCPSFDCSRRPNQEYNSCPALCPTDDCSQATPTGKCPLPGRIGIVLECNPKCRCIKGYWKLNETCVPYGECPGVCPANERYSECIQGECRALNCTDKDQSIPCAKIDPKFCKKGCVCEEGHLRNSNGTCVLKDQCESNITCGPNEVLNNCPASCKSDYCPTSEEDTKACTTPKVCPPPACECAFNYKRAANKTCIPTRDCPPFDCSCRPNQEYNSCPALCPTDDCSQATPTGKCPLPGRIGIVLECNPKCRCIKGYWKLNETCVPYGECPGVCPANERYSECIQGECRALNCTDKDESIPCIRIDPKFCKKGCVCEEGYFRNSNGTCVLKDQCESKITCGPNEVLNNCPASCKSDYCPTSEEDTKACTTPKVCPPPACECAFNYKRAANKTCIPTRDCPPFDCSCRPNQEYNSCPALCPTDDCSQATPTGKCPLPGRIGIVLECNPKCRCIKGYWKLNETCVPYGECPGVCPANEKYSECIQGECRALNCTDKDESIPCIRIDPKFCKKGCVCEEGYFRNSNGTCVLKDQCESNITCGPNEVLNNCPASYKSDYCPTSEEDTKACTTPKVCLPPACECAFNYKRAANKSCIPTRDCPPFDCSRRPNQEYNSCPALCPTGDCSQATPTGKCPLPGRIGIVLECNPKCRCIKGYWKLNETCVPYGECPGVCPANERYSECIQGECRALNCTDKDESIPCPRIIPKFCKKGCVCEEGHLRNSNGTCVPEDQCETAHVCPDNEEWSTCAQATCRAQNCSQKGKPIACPLIAEGYCIKACVCKQKHLRNENGVCVPEDQCPSQLTCGKNEVLVNCSSSCTSDHCPRSENEKQVCVKSNPCRPACKCRLNYRRFNGTCIPTRSCPPFSCKARPNEKYNPCPFLCPSDACSQARLKGQCPYNIKTILQCNPKCQCKDGYGRFKGICIPFAKCPGLCPKNEEYSPCVQATCRPQNCSDRDDKLGPCPIYDAESCQRGCVCKKNYYRNEKGVCVSYEQCGGPLCPNPNEYYWKSIKPCPPNTCEALVTRYICDENQKEEPGCLCNSGYLRHKNSTCVPICECPEMKGTTDCQ